MSVDYRDVFATTPAPPRPLSLHELGTLIRMGFPEVAKRLIKSPCQYCHGHPDGVLHKDACPGERKEPLPAAAQVAQPWQPRPMRRQNAA